MLPWWHLKCCLVIHLQKFISKNRGRRLSLNRTKAIERMIVNQATIKTLELSDEFAKNCIQKDWLSNQLLAFTFYKKIIITLYFFILNHCSMDSEYRAYKYVCNLYPSSAVLRMTAYVVCCLFLSWLRVARLLFLFRIQVCNFVLSYVGLCLKNSL